MKQLTELRKPIRASMVADWIGLAFTVGALFGVLLGWIAWKLP